LLFISLSSRQGSFVNGESDSPVLLHGSLRRTADYSTGQIGQMNQIIFSRGSLADLDCGAEHMQSPPTSTTCCTRILYHTWTEARKRPYENRRRRHVRNDTVSCMSAI